MKYLFFYGSILLVLLALLAVNRVKKLSMNDYLIGIASTAFPLAFDVALGGHFKLYYYISPRHFTTLHYNRCIAPVPTSKHNVCPVPSKK